MVTKTGAGRNIISLSLQSARDKDILCPSVVAVAHSFCNQFVMLDIKHIVNCIILVLCIQNCIVLFTVPSSIPSFDIYSSADSDKFSFSDNSWFIVFANGLWPCLSFLRLIVSSLFVLLYFVRDSTQCWKIRYIAKLSPIPALAGLS